MTINGLPFSSVPNINLKGVSSVKGSVLRFARTSSSSPIASTDYGLYVNASGQLVFSAAGTATTLGATGGSGSIPSLDAIFQGDQTLSLGGLSTLTIDRTSSNNNILTLTNTGAGSGVLLQITNVGTGSDIAGTSGSWTISKLGAITGLTAVLAGAASGTAALTLTAGDAIISDGQLSVTRVGDNAVALTVVDNTATTASAVVISGSGVFTGSTTTSFMTITPSGLTTGTAVYLPLAAMTTGIGVQVIANAITTGQALLVSSSAAGTQLTGVGRLLSVVHSGAASGTGTVAEISSAAADETVVFQVTASAALAAGVITKLSGSSMTTGTALQLNDLDSLTDGQGLHIASSATAISSTGHLLFVNHTGATGTSAVLSEFKTAATDETVVVKITTAAMINGVALSVVGTTGMTTGSLIRATSSTAGAVTTNGVYSFALTGAFTSTADTLGAFHVAGATTVTGTIMSILGGAQTTGIALHISDAGVVMTSGSLLRIATASTGAVATNGIVSIRATGAFTSTSNVGLVDVLASATTAGTVVRIAASSAGQTATELLRVVASGYTTGYTGNVANFIGCSTTGAANVVAITTVNTTDGTGLLVTANALTTGNAAKFTSSGTVTSAGSGVVNVTASGLTTGTGLLVTDGGSSNTITTGNILKVYSNANTTDVRGLVYIHNDNTAAVGVAPITVVNDSVQGTGSKFKRAATFCGISIWVSTDGTTPNGALTGDAVGDICLNASTGKPLICTGTNVWAAVA